jgi:hypothetical protein
MTLRSPDHAEIDEGGLMTVRTRSLLAANDVSAAAYDLFYDTAFSGWHHLEKLKEAVDALLVELGEEP